MEFITFLILITVLFGFSGFSESVLLENTWARYQLLDGFIADTGTIKTARSRVQCGMFCNTLGLCQSYFYHPGEQTSNCYLHDNVFVDSAGLTLAPNVNYYVPVNYTSASTTTTTTSPTTTTTALPTTTTSLPTTTALPTTTTASPPTTSTTSPTTTTASPTTTTAPPTTTTALPTTTTAPPTTTTALPTTTTAPPTTTTVPPTTTTAPPTTTTAPPTTTTAPPTTTTAPPTTTTAPPTTTTAPPTTTTVPPTTTTVPPTTTTVPPTTTTASTTAPGTTTPFQCHANDMLYHTVQLADSSTFTYKFHQAYGSYAEAINVCINETASLVKIRTAAKLDMIRTILNCPNFPTNTIYMVDGVYDGANYYMDDGSLSSYPAVFWGEFQPSKPANNPCVALGNTVLWLARSFRCSQTATYICEK